MARRPPDPHLQHALYHSLMMGPHHLPTVARRGGIGYELLGKICRGERHLLAEHLPAIYRGTQDVELFAELSGASISGLVVTEAPRLTTAAYERDWAPSMRTAALRVGASAGDVNHQVVDALEDNEITELDAKAIEKSIDELERQAEGLRHLLRQRQSSAKWT